MGNLSVSCGSGEWGLLDTNSCPNHLVRSVCSVRPQNMLAHAGRPAWDAQSHSFGMETVTWLPLLSIQGMSGDPIH